MFVNLRCNHCLSVLRCLSVCLCLFSLSPFKLNSLAVLTLALFCYKFVCSFKNVAASAGRCERGFLLVF